MFSFQAGEFFASAHRSATAQHSEIESQQQVGEDALEAPLLQEVRNLLLFHFLKLCFLQISLQTFLF